MHFATFRPIYWNYVSFYSPSRSGIKVTNTAASNCFTATLVPDTGMTQWLRPKKIVPNISLERAQAIKSGQFPESCDLPSVNKTLEKCRFPVNGSDTVCNSNEKICYHITTKKIISQSLFFITLLKYFQPKNTIWNNLASKMTTNSTRYKAKLLLEHYAAVMCTRTSKPRPRPKCWPMRRDETIPRRLPVGETETETNASEARPRSTKCLG